MKINLPPLRAVVAFEATARHRGFSRAAEELAVTQGAVSRQVILLEEFLGLDLLVRNPRDVTLTAAGERYLQLAREALRLIAVATTEAHTLAHKKGDELRPATKARLARALKNRQALNYSSPGFSQSFAMFRPGR